MPEDLQSILTDSNLHNAPGELTTKEILTRYRDIGKGNYGNVQRTVQAADAPAQSPMSAGGSRPSGPVATRVDADQYQANAWQKQSSVRQVHNANGQQQGFEYNAPNSPYARDQSGSNDSFHQQQQQQPNGPPPRSRMEQVT